MHKYYHIRMISYLTKITKQRKKIMVNLAQQVEHRSVDSVDLVQVQSFTPYIKYIVIREYILSLLD